MECVNKISANYRRGYNNLSVICRENWDLYFAQKFIFNSVAIEGNTCTQSEVMIIMQDGTLPADKSLEEAQEVKYHQKAWDYAKQNYKTQVLDEQMILKLHKKVLCHKEDLRPGEYRKVDIIIRNAEYSPPKAHHVNRFLQEYYTKLNEHWQNPIKKAAYAHAELTKIHPFTDGNGRTSRTVMNYILLQAWLPPVAITCNEKDEYFEALAVYDKTGSTEQIEQIIKFCVQKEYDMFKKMYLDDAD